MKNYWTGKTYLKIEKGYPWYVKGPNHDMCLKQLLKIGQWTISLRVDNTKKFKPKYTEKLLKVFDGILDGGQVYKGKNVYFIRDIPWVLKYIDDIETTDNWLVFYNKKNNSYIGYSHRAAQEFKIGDILFTGKTPKDLHKYYADKKLRWKMLKSLLKHHFKNEVSSFEDIFEDNIIGHGISIFIPFKLLGDKVIETKEQAYLAACNFAEYVS